MQVKQLEAVALLEEPIRRRVYRWVVAQGRAVSRDDVAGALAIRRTLAAFHLDRLVHGGLLTTEYRRLTGRTGPGAGRPAKLYRRSELQVHVSLPARQYELAARLMAEGMARVGKGKVPAELVAVARGRGVEMARDRVAGNGGDALASLRILLQDLGYEPEAGGGREIRSVNCPFDALIAEHRPIVCAMNLALHQGLLEGLGLEAAHAYLDPEPTACCVVVQAG